MRYADLHTHTFHSDGTRSPKEVIDVAKAAGIEIVSISDHDNIAAFFEIRDYAAAQGILLIPGTELSAEFKGVDVHILAYGFDPADQTVASRLASFRETRLRRGELIVEMLARLGFPVALARVRELAGEGSMGRPHVARALVEAEHVTDMQEAFDRFLGAGSPAYVPKQRFSIAEAVSMVRRAGGITSVAHPTLYPDHQTLVPEILDAGVEAIEAIHPDVDDSWREHYTELAADRRLLVTGGSDDHGDAKMMKTLGTIKVPEKILGILFR
jgi:hypothetical protein